MLSRYHIYHCRLVFLLGLTNNIKDQKDLEKEGKLHGDIVQVNSSNFLIFI